MSNTRLVVLRGNSASGKTSTAWRVRAMTAERLAIISQDTVRINILAEPDTQDGVNLTMIDTMTRLALDQGYHVLLEGVLATERYGTMLRRLTRDHPNRCSFFYFDLPWEVTVTRHATRKKAADFGPSKMRQWFVPHDVLNGVGEILIGPDSTLDVSARLILEALTAR
ncbi:AAA family ATPase [Kitasatospora purpeofusca]|uniref:AAA family ATPase n=1 Tax=Kitasatospora purpeofusca TaxID=67352 RepID=UPI0035DB3FD8